MYGKRLGRYGKTVDGSDKIVVKEVDTLPLPWWVTRSEFVPYILWIGFTSGTSTTEQEGLV